MPEDYITPSASFPRAVSGPIRRFRDLQFMFCRPLLKINERPTWSDRRGAQEYYANTGALKAAAQAARGGRAVGCSIVETFGKDPKPRELEVIGSCLWLAPKGPPKRNRRR